jgi:hypothetical protein
MVLCMLSLPACLGESFITSALLYCVAVVLLLFGASSEPPFAPILDFAAGPLVLPASVRSLVALPFE